MVTPCPVLTLEEAMEIIGNLRAENSSLKIRLAEMEQLVNLKTCTMEEALMSTPPINNPPSPRVTGKLTLEEARLKGLCRICGNSTKGTSIMLDYGKEWAHTSCLPPDRVENGPKIGGHLRENWRTSQ